MPVVCIVETFCILYHIGKLYRVKFLEVLDELVEATVGHGKEAPQTSELSEIDTVKEVQLYLGWATACVAAATEKMAEEDEMFRNENLFVEQIWTHHDTAPVDKEYVKKFYPEIIQLRSQRHEITLIIEEYFEFGLALLDRVRASCNQYTIKTLGTECVKKAFETLKQDKELSQKFSDCDNTYKDAVGEEFINAVYSTLLKKVFHAWAGTESTLFTEENTSRYCKDAEDVSLHEGLKTLSKKTATQEC